MPLQSLTNTLTLRVNNAQWHQNPSSTKLSTRVRFWLTKLLGICVKKTEDLIITVYEKQFVIKPVSQFAGPSKVG